MINGENRTWSPSCLQNFTVDELIPAKIGFVMNAFNNSEAIARVGFKPFTFFSLEIFFTRALEIWNFKMTFSDHENEKNCVCNYFFYNFFRLERLFGMITDLYIDHNKFKVTIM